jgi:hypothetical protein
VLQLVGRDSETGALVRYHAQPPDWSESEGPEEFARGYVVGSSARNAFTNASGQVM